MVLKVFLFLDRVEIIFFEGFKMKIYKYDLLEINVDVIVNVVNDKLLYGVGVVEVIVKRVGLDMIRECKDYIKKNKLLVVLKVFVFSFGKLKFKKIIYVVGLVWWDYKDKVKCLNDLVKIIINFLEKVKECRVRIVVMFIISLGILILMFCFIFMRCSCKFLIK